MNRKKKKSKRDEAGRSGDGTCLEVRRIFHLRQKKTTKKKNRNQRSHLFQLGASYTMSCAAPLPPLPTPPTSLSALPFIPYSWRGTADSLSSAPRPRRLISVIQLMRPGLWQAAGTYTKGPTQICAPRFASAPQLTQQPSLKPRRGPSPYKVEESHVIT